MPRQRSESSEQKVRWREGDKGAGGGAIKRRKPSKLRSVRDLSPSTRAHDSRKELNIIVTRNDELRIMLELHTLYT